MQTTPLSRRRNGRGHRPLLSGQPGPSRRQRRRPVRSGQCRGRPRHQPQPLQPRPRTHQAARRRWTAYNIFTLWANDVHSLGNYAFAIGLFALGLGAGRSCWPSCRAALLFGLLSLSGFMGEKTGVPFPVMSRISFGIHGAQIPPSSAAAVAIVWFGIQTYLASVVLRVMLVAHWSRPSDAGHQPLLGLSTLGWIAFVGLWIIQVVIVSYGMEMIRKYEAFAGPVILVTMVALAVWIFIGPAGRSSWTPHGA